MKQKGKSQNGDNKKKHAKFPKKREFLTPYQCVRNVRFSENFPCFVFLKHSF